ncbi:MAG: VWA domain-containing protein [Planctomycetales bacterium]|nr:VWA domain-containing protein [Planctomycetales bacterium]
MDSFEFRNAWWLLLLIPAVPLTLYLARRPTASVRFSSLTIVSGATRSWRIRLSMIPTFLYAAGVACAIIALAGPRTGDRQTRIHRDGIAIMMVVDLSSSMNARDLVENDRSVDRLQVVKKVFRDFVLGHDDLAGRPNDMIGLVAFAGYADSICPLTFDHQNLAIMVQQLEIVSAQSEDGTAMGDGLALAVERLRKSDAKSRVAILLTDGENNAGTIDPSDAAKLAKDFAVKVYTIGTGTQGRAPAPFRDPFTGETFLRPVEVRIDEKTLQAIASNTGGAYFRATDADALNQVYEQIDKLERTTVAEDAYLRFTEHFAGILCAGLIFLVSASTLRSTIFRQIP